jgi:hypothetical protein
MVSADGKPATQSSTYLHAVFAIAGYAVDGNTDGKFSNAIGNSRRN